MHHFIVRTLNVCVYTAINMYIESSEHNHCWLQPAWLNLPKLMTFLLCPVCLFPISSLYDAFFSSPFLITSQLIATNRHLLLSPYFLFPSRMCVLLPHFTPLRNYPKKLTSRPSSPPILVRLARRWTLTQPCARHPPRSLQQGHLSSWDGQ